MDGLYSAASEHFFAKVDALDAGKIGKCKNLSEFEKDQIMMARRLGHARVRIHSASQTSQGAHADPCPLTKAATMGT